MSKTSTQAGAQSVIGRETEVKFGHLLNLPTEVGFYADGSVDLVMSNGGALGDAIAGANAYAYGWDTVFAIRLPEVNRAIANAKSSPSQFVQQAPDNSCSMSGTFGDWEVSGGDSTVLHFRVPITHGIFTLDGVSYSVAGTDAIIEVGLEYLAHNHQPTTQQLMLRQPGDNGEPAVSLIELRLAENSDIDLVDPNFLQQALLKGLLNLWFQHNLHQFQHVFTAVEINQRIDHEQFQWLSPTYTSYALCRGETPESSVLGVLCMTQNRNPSGTAAQLSPNAIPGAAPAGFLISQERFLTQMVIPGLVRALPGSSTTDLALHKDLDQVVNTRHIPLKKVRHLGTDYEPTLFELNVRVLGDEVIVHSVTRTDIALGTYCEVKVTSFQRLTLADKPDGTQTMVYEESRPAIEDHCTKSTAEGERLQFLLTIALAVIMLILAILTAGATLIVGLIIVALLMGLKTAGPQLIADVVGNKVSDNSPSLALLVSSATAPIRWAGSSDFRLTELGLAHSLQLGGNPQFA